MRKTNLIQARFPATGESCGNRVVRGKYEKVGADHVNERRIEVGDK